MATLNTTKILGDLIVNGEIKLQGKSVATELWVNSQGFLKSTDLGSYATQSWVNSQGFLKSSALNGYATESWVEGKGYQNISEVNSAIEERMDNYTPTGYLKVKSLSNGVLHLEVSR